MVTHYQGPRSRGQVVSSHLCNLWAYIGVHTPSDSYLPAHSAPSQDEGGCGEFPTPHAGWPSCPLPGGPAVPQGKGHQLPPQRVPARPLPRWKGSPTPAVVQLAPSGPGS